MGLFRRKKDHPDATAPGPLCSCGTPLDLVDMDYGFQLPDEVFAQPQDELRSRIEGLAKVFVLDGSRGFVRALLPVPFRSVELERGYPPLVLTKREPSPPPSRV